ncbi:DUF1330 domain-containing protein [Nostoc sp. NIES-2111]
MAAPKQENGESMPYTLTVALDLADPALYAQYRAAMRPLLEHEGGLFLYDFTISETLIAADGQSYNRLFLLQFPSQAHHDRFFAHPDYLALRHRFFTPAVRSFAILATA